jgi:hypothetical protein
MLLIACLTSQGMNWSDLAQKKIKPPKIRNELDVSNFCGEDSGVFQVRTNNLSNCTYASEQFFPNVFTAFRAEIGNIKLLKQ